MEGSQTDRDVSLVCVSKSFGATAAVREVSLSIERGTLLSLLGPSGCGKTTTLRLIAGFEQPSSGEIFIRDTNVTNVPPYKRDFAMVFQNFALFPHMSVAENVAFGPKMRKVARAERDEQVQATLRMVKLDGFESRYPGQLSGGQQQRVALARAIVLRPAVLLLDEPFGALDKNLREAMQVELRQLLQRRLGITTVFVTHDQEEALTMSDRIAVMRDGVIDQIGHPKEVYEKPATEFVATFLGGSNILLGKVTAKTKGEARANLGEGEIVLLTERKSIGDEVRVTVRPERIRVSATGEGLPARIRDVVYRGAATQLIMESGGQRIMAIIQNADTAAGQWMIGDRVLCSWELGSVVVLNNGD